MVCKVAEGNIIIFLLILLKEELCGVRRAQKFRSQIGSDTQEATLFISTLCCVLFLPTMASDSSLALLSFLAFCAS